ncbi:MAG: 16S rRNA (guanine(966)-N(2))-methyltransferase RsmD [Clostridia bacterium]|nr:16S rRNA (guanine(966)-N(2))-methyltransferase RsmD [Clostridia bacterium]
MRIIAGTAKGRRFDAPQGRDTRPTLDRVKEAIFGSIQFRVPGAVVLDLFSGSGNMGLEALSRGAKQAICVDVSPSCGALIAANGKKLGLAEGLTVLCQDYERAIEQLASQGIRADIAFLDPPYASGFGEKAAMTLFQKGLVAPDGIVVLEHAFAQPPVFGEGPWQVSAPRKYGVCGVTTLIWREDR